MWFIIIGGSITSSILERKYDISKFVSVPIHLGFILVWGVLGMYWYEKWLSSVKKRV
jgi:uncharacterized membrane protein YciS (DUF1049 family)